MISVLSAPSGSYEHQGQGQNRPTECKFLSFWLNLPPLSGMLALIKTIVVRFPLTYGGAF